ncbi:MAG: ABC transporter permease subunit [Anaerolineae bacterium]|nr:ABC transporter permease subunit [Anaerolineae bacterium]
MNWRIIRAIALKDLREVRQNGMAWKPMLILPLIFCVIMPLIFLIGPQIAGQSAEEMFQDEDISQFFDMMPEAVKATAAGMDEQQTFTLFLLAFLLAPLFLIMPIMTASVIGSDSFVGEKERKTMEALLYTPATERELFTGKMLASVVPAVLLTWGGFIVYTLVLNIAGGPIMGRIWFPTPAWWPLILWVTPAVATMGMAAAVLISARVNTFIEAYQTTGLLVLPVILLVIGQIGGVVYLSVEIVLLVGLVIWLIDAALLWFGLRNFHRTALLGTR